MKPKKKLEDKLPYKDDFGSKYMLSGIEVARKIAAAQRLRESAGFKRESVTAGGVRHNLRKL